MGALKDRPGSPAPSRRALRVTAPQQNSRSPRWIASASAVSCPSASCRTRAGAILSGAFEPFTPKPASDAPTRRREGGPAGARTPRAGSPPPRGSRRARRGGGSSRTGRPGASRARQARIQPTSGARRPRPRTHAPAPLPGSGEARTAPGSKNGGLVTTRSAASSASPGRAAGAGVEHVGRRRACAGARPLRAAFSAASVGQAESISTQSAGRARAPQRRQPDRADPGADIDEAAFGEVGGGGEQGRVRSDPMPARAAGRGRASRRARS